MKNYFFFMLMSLLLVNNNLLAQQTSFTKDATRTSLTEGELITFAGTLKTTDSLVSKKFEVSKYDADAWTTKPSLGMMFKTDSSVIKAMVILHGTWNGTDYIVLDTLLSVDQSVNLYKTKGFATITSVPPWYRLIFKGLTGNKLASFDLGLYYYKPDK